MLSDKNNLGRINLADQDRAIILPLGKMDFAILNAALAYRNRVEKEG